MLYLVYACPCLRYNVRYVSYLNGKVSFEEFCSYALLEFKPIGFIHSKVLHGDIITVEDRFIFKTKCTLCGKEETNYQPVDDIDYLIDYLSIGIEGALLLRKGNVVLKRPAELE